MRAQTHWLYSRYWPIIVCDIQGFQLLPGKVMSNLLIHPLLAMMLLTMLVWLYMYYLRIGFSIRNRIHAQKLSTPEKCHTLLPENVNQPSNNLKNLFEAPIIFYAVCILVLITQHSDMTFVLLAWSYVALRCVHSFMHCVVNYVMGRFISYFISTLILWCMVCKFAWQVFTAQ